MKKALITIILMIIILPFTYTQNINKVEASLGFGYTIVNAENYAEISLSGEEHGSFQINTQLFFSDFRGFKFGGELGYQKLFEYSFMECSGCYTAYRNVDAFKVLGVARKELSEKWQYEFYLGAYMYQGYFAIGTGASILYNVQLGDKWYLPVRFRGDLIIDTDAPMLPMGLTLGMGYKF